MSRKSGLLLVATATAILTFAVTDDAQARRRGGSWGSNGSYGSWGSYGGNGSCGSFGGRFARWRNGSCGSHGGYGSYGSHGGTYYHERHDETAPAAPEEVHEGQHEAGYRGEQTLQTDEATQAPGPHHREQAESRDSAESQEAREDAAGGAEQQQQ